MPIPNRPACPTPKRGATTHSERQRSDLQVWRPRDSRDVIGRRAVVRAVRERPHRSSNRTGRDNQLGGCHAHAMCVMWFTALTAVCHIPEIHDRAGASTPRPAVDASGALTAHPVLVTPRRAAVYPLSCLSFSSTTPWLILYLGGLCPECGGSSTTQPSDLKHCGTT